MPDTLFHPYSLTAADRKRLDADGHLILSGLLRPEACDRLAEALASVEAVQGDDAIQARRFAAERSPYLAGLIARPELLSIARWVLGDPIRFDHCVSLNRLPGDHGIGWHSHGYAEDRRELGFVRIFFYVSGFEVDDGGLKVVPGSHLYRDTKIGAQTDEELRSGWLRDRPHPITGHPLQIDRLACPPGSVVLMWTHAAHAVSPRRPGSATRWAVVYAYRNPGAESRARWITPEFEHNPPADAADLMSLY